MVADNVWILSILSILAPLVVWTRRQRLPLPPGPAPRFLVGNAFDMPKKDKYVRYHELNREYGDIVYLNALGQPIVLLETQQVAIDLLEKRSAKYSDRRLSVMAELTDFTWFFATSPYGPRWRKTRRAFYEFMSPNAVVQYRPVGERAVKRYLLRLLDQPDQYREDARHMFNATVISVSYGLDVHAKPENAKYVQIAEQTMNTFANAFTLGRYHVETFPILRHLPGWFPLAQFQREIPTWTADARRLRDVPWEAANDAQAGVATPSMASMLIMDAKTEEDVEIAKAACASAYAAGSDTIYATFNMFVAAMALFPEAQQRAQAELGSIIGPGRLPTTSDKASLPYVTALLNEVYRWKPVVPLGVTHRAMEEDEYRGYRIPRGTVTIQNPWAYSRDPAVYPEPDQFMPERFLKDGRLHLGERDPGAFVFGYGRRICPGRYFAEELLFVTIASVLHCFTISGPKDEDGRPVRFELQLTNTSPMHPEPFPCDIRPRSNAADALVRNNPGESNWGRVAG
ncbi:cytochrome P450 [Daedaleopsis nitida]|nr:cytochrome P450 [Daedaleopsis nitida]